MGMIIALQILLFSNFYGKVNLCSTSNNIKRFSCAIYHFIRKWETKEKQKIKVEYTHTYNFMEVVTGTVREPLFRRIDAN